MTLQREPSDFDTPDVFRSSLMLCHLILGIAHFTNVHQESDWANNHSIVTGLLITLTLAMLNLFWEI